MFLSIPSVVRKLLIRKVCVLVAIVISILLLPGCDTTSRLSILPTPTTTISSTPTLPPLTAEKGWHVALSLGNAGAIQNTSGSFVATKPYKIFFQCMGSGTLRITYPQAEEKTPCSATPQLNGTSELPPPAGTGQVTINVTTQGDVLWNAIAVTQDWKRRQRLPANGQVIPSQPLGRRVTIGR